MAWRKWAVRGLVFFALGGFLLAGVVYRYLTNPEAVRRQLLARLQSQFTDTNASVESARLRLFGGILVQELRLARRDNLDKTDFLYAPLAIFYHDKQRLLQGMLALRKIEIHRPRLRVVRDRDGQWNLAGILGEADLNQRLPTIVVKQGTIVLEDRRAAPGTAPIEIKNVHFTLVNDPLPLASFEGSGTCEVAGVVRVRGSWQRGGGAVALTVEAPELTLGSELVRRVTGYCPEAASHARQLQGKGAVSATLNWDARAMPPLSYTVEGKLTEGSFNHSQLPWPLLNLHGSFRCINGVVPHAELHATAGTVGVDLTVRDLAFTQPAGTSWLEAARELELTARHVPVNAELFRLLPADLRDVEQRFNPAGPLTARVIYRRLEPGRWRREIVLQPEDMTARFHRFDYTVRKVRGNVTLLTTFGGSDAEGERSGRFQLASYSPGLQSPSACEESVVKLDLVGEAVGRPVYLKGEVEGEWDRCAIKLDLWANDVPLDQRLVDALPPMSRRAASAFHPTGRIDFRIFLRRLRGQTELADRYLVYLHDGTVCYDVFPLPLRDVSGTLDILPDHWEFRDFVGRHKDGLVRASGRSHPLPAKEAAPVSVRVTAPPPPVTIPVPGPGPLLERSERVSLMIAGENLPLDDQFRAALAPGRPALARAWDTFALTGTMNFAARIDDLPDQASDIDVTVSVGGCRMNPTFFRYPMEDVSATVRYARDSAWLYDFHGRHGESEVRVGRGRVHLPPGGGFWAKLDRLEAKGLTLDRDLLRALPRGLRKGLEGLNLQKPVDLSTVLVVSQPAEASARETIYWRGNVKLQDAAFKAGVDWTEVTGALSSEGLYNGEQLEGVTGNLVLDRAKVLGQPLRQVHAPLAVWKNSPDILRLPGLRAELFGGSLGGEARVEFGSIFRYELLLKTSQVQLEQFGRHNLGQKSEMSGLATAGLHLWGEGVELDGLKGNGVVDVPSGKMYRLPLLLDLLKWLGLRLPDRTAFEQARATFGIDGERVQISRLDLFGNAVSVRGSGTMNLDGSNLDLDLNADWGRVAQLLPAGINDLSREISNQLLRIKVKGKVSDVRFEKALVPAVTDPLKRAWSGIFPTAGGGKK